MVSWLISWLINRKLWEVPSQCRGSSTLPTFVFHKTVTATVPIAAKLQLDLMVYFCSLFIFPVYNQPFSFIELHVLVIVYFVLYIRVGFLYRHMLKLTGQIKYNTWVNVVNYFLPLIPFQQIVYTAEFKVLQIPQSATHLCTCPSLTKSSYFEIHRRKSCVLLWLT